MRGGRGFSLIELLVVVAVLLVIAAIAIPNYLRSKLRANEASAVSSLRVITTAETTYSTSYGTGFAPLANLGGSDPCTASANTACLIDSALTSGFKSGYAFTTPVPGALGTTSTPNTAYQAHADPQSRGNSGTNSFFVDESGVVRFNSSAVATSADNAIQ